MNNFLETGISLVLIFFIFSVIAYVIQELIAVNMKYRSKMLWKSMAQLMDGFILEGRTKLMKAMPESGATSNTNDFYNHAQIQSLRKNLNNRPAYIPAANFALAVMDIVAKKGGANTGTLFGDIQTALRGIAAKNKLEEVLDNLIKTSGTIQELQKKIEDWFNSYMNRVTGWYESHTVVSVRLIAIALTLIFNINVIKLARTIYNDGNFRSSLVAMSERIVDHPENATPFYTRTFEQLNETKKTGFLKRLSEASNDSAKNVIQVEMDSVMGKLADEYTKKQRSVIDSSLKDLKSAGLPLGWEKRSVFKEQFWVNEGPTKDCGTNFLLALVGWIIGACCIAMGAPFWFDMLNKLVNVRRTGVRPGK